MWWTQQHPETTHYALVLKDGKDRLNRAILDLPHNRRCMIGSASAAVTNKVFTEKPRYARIEFVVERCPVEARRYVSAKARDHGRKLRRARREKSKVASRHDMNVGCPGKVAGDATGAP